MDKDIEKGKKRTGAPKMWDNEDFKAPDSAKADSYHERLERQKKEVISAIVEAETYPDLKKHFRKDRTGDKNEKQ